MDEEDGDSSIPHTITSLYPYYCTLPRFVREDPSVKTAYKALEFTKPTLSIQEKEAALNFVCTAALQMDECIYQYISNLVSERAFYHLG
jgi:hypothetical protein